MLREQAYWAVLSGASGQLYGSRCAVTVDEKDEQSFLDSSRAPWKFSTLTVTVRQRLMVEPGLRHQAHLTINILVTFQNLRDGILQYQFHYRHLLHDEFDYRRKYGIDLSPNA